MTRERFAFPSSFLALRGGGDGVLLFDAPPLADAPDDEEVPELELDDDEEEEDLLETDLLLLSPDIEKINFK